MLRDSANVKIKVLPAPRSDFCNCGVGVSSETSERSLLSLVSNRNASNLSFVQLFDLLSLTLTRLCFETLVPSSPGGYDHSINVITIACMGSLHCRI